MGWNGTPSRPLADKIVAKFKAVPYWKRLTGAWSSVAMADQIEADIQRHVKAMIQRHSGK